MDLATPFMTYKPMLITPEMAAKMLRENTSNRPVRPQKVTLYANLMKRGEWRLTHQGIAFTRKHRLIDGQHRLLAIIAAGLAVWVMVAEDVDDEVYLVIDQHAQRSFADTLGKSQAATCAIARIATLVVPGRIVTAESVSKVYGVFGETAEHLVSYCPSNRKGYNATTRAIAIIRAMENNGENYNYVFETYRNLILMNMEELPRIALSWIRQLSDNTMSREDVACRMWTALDIEKRDLGRLLIKDQIHTTHQIRKAALDIYTTPVVRELLAA